MKSLWGLWWRQMCNTIKWCLWGSLGASKPRKWGIWYSGGNLYCSGLDHHNPVSLSCLKSPTRCTCHCSIAMTYVPQALWQSLWDWQGSLMVGRDKYRDNDRCMQFLVTFNTIRGVISKSGCFIITTVLLC